MSLNYVTSNTPGNQAIDKLMLNDLSLDGKSERALFNKLELDALYTKISPRSYNRDVVVGNTISSFSNWSCVVSDSGYSVWSYPVTSFVNNPNNQLYCNNTKLLYMGAATTESTSLGFNNVFLGTSKRTGETFTDLTTEASTVSGTPFSIVNNITVTNELVSAAFTTKNLSYLNILESSLTVSKTTYSATYTENIDYMVDYRLGTVTILSSGRITVGTQLYTNYTVGSTLYVGCSATFTLLNVGLSTKGVANTFRFDYSSGAMWHNFMPTLDSTNNFSVNGNISISGLTGWSTATVNGVASKYWLKIRTVNTGLVYPYLYSITRADNAATKLVSMSQIDLSTNNYKWAYYNNKIYVAIPNNGDTVSEGIKYIKSTTSTDRKQNFFVYNNQYIINYQIPIVNNIIINSGLNLNGILKISSTSNYNILKIKHIFTSVLNPGALAGTILLWNTNNTSGNYSSIAATSSNGTTNSMLAFSTTNHTTLESSAHLWVTNSSGNVRHIFSGNSDGALQSYYGIKFPTSDPHIAGAWWDNSGTLTKSAG